MYNKVELCGVNTAELPILSEQEKRDLLTRARAGDKEARQSMIEGNLRLVLSVVQRFSQRGENMDDLFQVGCIGLIKAIDNFDPAQQVRFSTYGVPMIIGDLTGVSIQLGGTTLLIVVGVALETGRSLEGYMTARYHKGFLE